ncbi:thermostable hemolysin [Marinobacterium sp. YM272]|uniref:thermostable hemolysin n=1 Tax=Marinobacterium sp. YM272 TaxID=3421654 RepID=UPI003D7FC8B8
MIAPKPVPETREKMYLHGPGDLSRARIEAFIRERFAAIHSAWIDDFLPTLISTRNDRSQLLAAAGFQWASDNPLFLETYLDTPVESCLREFSHSPVSRQTIVEFGNLATTTPGEIRKLILVLASYFGQRGMDWAVLTLTPTLINSFTRLGLVLHSLAPARPELLKTSRSYWGRYYDLNPRVVAINVRANKPRLQLLERLSTTRASLSTSLLPPEPVNDRSLFL